MRILGIDTAMRSTGYGIIEFADIENIKIVDCGIIKNKQNLTHSQCVKRLATAFRGLIENYNIDAAAIEGTFYKTSIRTTMILGYAKGCVMTVLSENEIPIYEYSPKEIKLSITGKGSASKRQIAIIISNMLGIDISNLGNDATDALGLAICHANRISQPLGELFIKKPI